MLSVGQGSRPEASRLCKYLVLRFGDSLSQNHSVLILSVLAPPRPVGGDRPPTSDGTPCSPAAAPRPSGRPSVGRAASPAAEASS